MKKSMYPVTLLMLAITLFVFTGCSKSDTQNPGSAELARLTTTTVSNITSTTALTGGNISDDGGATVTARGVCYSTNANPTIADQLIAGGTGSGNFSINLTGLQAATHYHVRAYASNTAGTNYGDDISFTTDVNNGIPGTVTDIDGNTYHTITIGTQTWMTENLRVSHYRNGDPVPNVVILNDWSLLSTGAWCHYDNNVSNETVYGKLYNWYAVDDSRMLAPAGWHIPDDAEWNALTDYLGGFLTAGQKMKEPGNTHWIANNIDVTNSSGFTGLPGGDRADYGSFLTLQIDGNWWSSTLQGSGLASYRGLNHADNIVDINSMDKRFGCSVRCVKD